MDKHSDTEQSLSTMIKEWEVVNIMLERSYKEGLQTEVVLSYGQFILSGATPVNAAASALNEWDCL